MIAPLAPGTVFEMGAYTFEVLTEPDRHAWQRYRWRRTTGEQWVTSDADWCRLIEMRRGVRADHSLGHLRILAVTW